MMLKCFLRNIIKILMILKDQMNQKVVYLMHYINHHQNLSKLYRLIALNVFVSAVFGLGTAEFTSASVNVAENVSGGYVDITIRGDSGGGTIGLLGIRYRSTSTMTAKYNGGTFSDDADDIYNAAALGSDDNSSTDNQGTDIQVYFSGETSLTISIKIDDDNKPINKPIQIPTTPRGVLIPK